MDLDIDRSYQRGSRVLTESLTGARNRAVPPASVDEPASIASIEGLTTTAELQTLGSAKYFDTAVKAHVETVAVAYEPKWRPRWPKWKRFTISFEDDDY